MGDEKDMEDKIEVIVLGSLGALKKICADNKLEDRETTLTLHYFLNRFLKNGWKGEKPSKVLQDILEVIKTTDDSIIPIGEGRSLSEKGQLI